MKIIFLGTNGWFDTHTGNTICTLIDSKEGYIILDAGNGIYKLDPYIKENKPVYLFISHLHIDHIEGLHVLNKSRFPQGLKIFSYRGAKQYLDVFVNSPFTVPFTNYHIPVSVNELSEGQHLIPFKVTALELFHAGFCLGYRFELEGKIITYCCDTGICDNDFLLSKNADVLIHESSYRQKNTSSWGHTAPIEAAQLAEKSGVKKLALTHFAATLYTSAKDRQDAKDQARAIFPKTITAKDGMVLDI